jgi:uncharacterized protein (TIGR02145 family)
MSATVGGKTFGGRARRVLGVRAAVIRIVIVAVMAMLVVPDGGGSGVISTPCYSCGGSGWGLCNFCTGTGRMYNAYQRNIYSPMYVTCSLCGGSGRTRCGVCNGSGQTYTYYADPPASGSYSDEDVDKANEMLKKAVKLLKKEKYNELLTLSNEIINLIPDHYNGYYLRGRAYFERKEYEKTISDMSKCLQIGVDEKDARGLVYYQRGRSYIMWSDKFNDNETRYAELLKKAKSDLEEAENLDPEDLDVSNLLNSVRFVLAKLPEQHAKPAQQPQIASDPKDAAEAAYKRGRAADNNKNYDLAVKEFTEAIRLAPNGSDDYYFHRAKVYLLYLKKYDAAIADLNNALRLKADPESYFLRGVAYHVKGDYAKAIADLEKSLQLDPDNDEAKEALASARQKAGLGSGGSGSQTTAQAAYERGKAAYNNKNYDLAVKEFTEAIRLDPKGNDNYYYYRAQIYIVRANYDAAIADLNRALELEPDPVSYSSRGAVYMLTGNLTKAIADFEKSLQLDPNNNDVKNVLALARQKAGSGGASPPVQQASPTPSNTFTDSRDGKVYKKVKIGSQTWMAQNLNYAADGSKCYENNAGNCDKYGRLYDWNTATKACPAGWRLPRDEEWTALVDYAGGKSTAGTKLKSSTGWKSKSGVPAGTDNYGFSALSGGYGDGGSGAYFISAGERGFWWSATEDGARDAWFRRMGYDGEDVHGYYRSKTYLYSVRCVQD